MSNESRGYNTRAGGFAGFAEGYFAESDGVGAHAEGSTGKAIGDASHTEGFKAVATGRAAHAEGGSSKANGDASHAEGYLSEAGAAAAHAEGSTTKAMGEDSHAEGRETQALSDHSHAEGYQTIAGLERGKGLAAHAQGYQTRAEADFSHAEGFNTRVLPEHKGSHIMGLNGETQFPYAWHLAYGVKAGPNTNTAVIDGATGNLHLQGAVFASNAADYAEMFETIDGKPIDVGYFVTLEGEKIRLANAKDEYVLGITSVNPAMLADSGELRWKELYSKDEWGRTLYRDVEVDDHDNETEDYLPTVVRSEPILNPEWDPAKKYVPRSQRPEWAPVGMMGKLLVRDDGTCAPNGFCKPNKWGIATKSKKGFRVMARTGEAQVLILVSPVGKGGFGHKKWWQFWR